MFFVVGCCVVKVTFVSVIVCSYMSSGKHPCAGLAFWCHPFLFWKNKIIAK